MQQQRTISWSNCDVQQLVDFIWQPEMTGTVGGLRKSSKALTKAKVAPKRGHAHCLVICCPSDPAVSWIPVKPLHLRSIASKSLRCAENWNTCSQLWSRERAQLFSTTVNHKFHYQCSKSWTNWTQNFALSAMFAWLLTNRLPLQASQEIFAEKMFPQPAGCRKCFTRICQILKHGFLCYRNKLISHWQKCIGCNDYYFD